MVLSTWSPCAGARRRAVLCALAGAVAGTLSSVTVDGHPGASGSVVGQVDVVARTSRKLATAGSYPGRTVELPAPRATSELQNVLVYLDSAGVEPSVPVRVTIRQDHEEFVPHVVAVSVGSTVDFPNGDAIFHNVFSLSRAATFDLGRYPRDASRSRTFTKPGLVKVFCHLHSHMSAVVRVFPHPHFVVPDARGHFALTGLPPGPHVIAAWHERVGETRRAVTVTPGEAVEVSLSLPVVGES